MKNRLITLALIVALGLAAAGLHYRIPVIIALVLVALGVFSGVSGIRMIVTRRAEIPTGESMDASREHHTGTSAQLWGLLFLILSVPLVLLGVAYWRYGDHPPADILAGVMRSPVGSGLLIVACGVAIGLYGLTRLLPARATFRETERGPVARLVAGVYVCSIAAMVIVAGVVRALSPGTLTRIRDATYTSLLGFMK